MLQPSSSPPGRLHSCDVLRWRSGCNPGTWSLDSLQLARRGRGIGCESAWPASSVRHHIRTNHVIASISVMFMKGRLWSRTKDRLHSFQDIQALRNGLASISRMEHRPRMTGRIATPCCGCSTKALATEIVCVLRYRRHYFMAQGMNAESVKAEFLTHAGEEQTHADQLAARIVQLGGEPNLSPGRSDGAES